MKLRLISFGELELDGQRYDHDVLIEAGQVRKRDKKGSKALRGQYGHTPLSAAEYLPLSGKTLYIGTGAQGALPILPEVLERARQAGVELIACPTPDLAKLFEPLQPQDIHALIHVTC